MAFPLRRRPASTKSTRGGGWLYIRLYIRQRTPTLCYFLATIDYANDDDDDAKEKIFITSPQFNFYFHSNVLVCERLRSCSAARRRWNYRNHALTVFLSFLPLTKRPIYIITNNNNNNSSNDVLESLERSAGGSGWRKSLPLLFACRHELYSCRPCCSRAMMMVY